MTPGITLRPDGNATVTVWAPFRSSVEIILKGSTAPPVRLEPDGHGYWVGTLSALSSLARYTIRLDGELERPDPASGAQPEGVHGPSAVVDHLSFPWEDAGWKGIPLEEYVLYELHVGTFTPEGTFDAILPRLGSLRDLGITAIELMPLAQFPGERNWGYDGVYPYAVQWSYGGPDGLKRLVNACHAAGLAVVLDVVYNHLGPEGNYLRDFGPYFTDRYRTPWGEAVNFDGPYSDEVRSYFIENALFWFRNYHIDALRVDAIHAIVDTRATSFFSEMTAAADTFSRESGPRRYLIAESNLNDTRVIRGRGEWGDGFDAVWCDDIHHTIHTVLTGEHDGYYSDFGTLEQLAEGLRSGFVYHGQYSVFRRRRHGVRADAFPPVRFVAFSQNHDQIGNRMLGERLSTLVPFEALKLAAGIVILSPYLPLFFMGEEYGEKAPFLFFVSHGDASLVDAVRRGRRDEFRGFEWHGEPPDPQDPGTFRSSKLRWEWQEDGKQAQLRAWYRRLLQARRALPSLRAPERDTEDLMLVDNSLVWRRGTGSAALVLVFHAAPGPGTLRGGLPPGRWNKVIDSADPSWGGPGTGAPGVTSGGSAFSITPYQTLVYIAEEPG